MKPNIIVPSSSKISASDGCQFEEETKLKEHLQIQKDGEEEESSGEELTDDETYLSNHQKALYNIIK